MKKIITCLSAALMLTSVSYAEDVKSNCHCKNCACTKEKHCGCFSEKGCNCPKADDPKAATDCCNCSK